MKAITQYTTFVGDINGLNAELKKASQDGRKPILLNTESYVEGDALKKRVTTYTVVFEQSGLLPS